MDSTSLCYDKEAFFISKEDNNLLDKKPSINFSSLIKNREISKDHDLSSFEYNRKMIGKTRRSYQELTKDTEKKDVISQKKRKSCGMEKREGRENKKLSDLDYHEEEHLSPYFYHVSLLVKQVLGEKAASFINRLDYWMSKDTVGKVIEGRKWVYNTLESWSRQLCIPGRTLSREIERLERLGVICKGCFNERKSDRTLWYTIDWEVLKKIVPGLKEKGRKPVKEARTTRLPPWQHPCGQIGNIINKDTQINIKYSFSEKDLKKDHQIHEAISIFQKICEVQDKIALTPSLASEIVETLQVKFKNSLQQWKRFCEAVASSRFLMGKVTQFKASLRWLLRLDVIERIYDGEFNVNTRLLREEPIQMQDLSTKTSQEKRQESPAVKEIRDRMIKCVRHWDYEYYLKEATLSLEEGALVITVDNPFYRSQIENPLIWSALFNEFKEYSIDVRIRGTKVFLKEEIASLVPNEKQEQTEASCISDESGSPATMDCLPSPEGIPGQQEKKPFQEENHGLENRKELMEDFTVNQEQNTTQTKKTILKKKEEECQASRLPGFESFYPQDRTGEKKPDSFMEKEEEKRTPVKVEPLLDLLNRISHHSDFNKKINLNGKKKESSSILKESSSCNDNLPGRKTHCMKTRVTKGKGDPSQNGDKKTITSSYMKKGVSLFMKGYHMRRQVFLSSHLNNNSSSIYPFFSRVLRTLFSVGPPMKYLLYRKKKY